MNLDISLVRENFDKVRWSGICRDRKLSEEFIREFQDKIDWCGVSCYQTLSEEFIREFQNKVYWNCISYHQRLSEEFIREFQNKVNWDNISACQKLSEDFIREFQDKVNWNYISFNQKLSENFIKELHDKVDWEIISFSQKLSEEFIREFQDKVYWNYISAYQKLSENFIKEFNLKIPESSWANKNKEWKFNYIKENTNYEIIGDKIIAYKSCRFNGCSIYNFQYKYDVGNVYESHADFLSGNENSFGLSAWTKEKAKEYCNEKLLKVEINIEDIACIVHNGHKIRASKIKILEDITDK